VKGEGSQRRERIHLQGAGERSSLGSGGFDTEQEKKRKRTTSLSGEIQTVEERTWVSLRTEGGCRKKKALV